jgi:hypothetical protein
MPQSHTDIQPPTDTDVAPDRNPLDRPGVPQELDPPQPLANAHWIEPDRQISERPPLVGNGRRLTPVFSTATPPRGLSGLVRKLAYRAPDYRTRRWALLILADKLDVLESNPKKLVGAVAAASLVGLGLYGLTRLRPRARFF